MHATSWSKQIKILLWCFLNLPSRQLACARKMFVDVWRLFVAIWTLLRDLPASRFWIRCALGPHVDLFPLWQMTLAFFFFFWQKENKNILSVWEREREEVFGASFLVYIRSSVPQGKEIPICSDFGILSWLPESLYRDLRGTGLRWRANVLLSLTFPLGYIVV